MDREVQSNYRVDLDGSNSYQEAIEGTETFSIDPLNYREVSRLR